MRIWDWGNPVIHVDEQYYLLVGDRMLRGALPYVDVWDRKPVGLFLLFAGFRLLPGDGILAYQISATLAAALTAMLVASGAERVGAHRRGGLLTAILYLVGLSLLGGRGGQAPVFYNLPIAAAGLLTLTLPGRSVRGIVASGAAACLLAGIAIQMKYTPAIEGSFFGLAHVYALWRRGALRALPGAALLWLGLGLLPTALAIGYYAHVGQFGAWWFANITSIGLRPGYPFAEWAMRLLGIVAQLAPLGIAAGIGWRTRPRTGLVAASNRLAFGWLAAATLGFAAIGTFFDHYALPLLAPLTIAAAPVLGRHAKAAIALLTAALLLLGIEAARRPRDGAAARQVAALVRAETGKDCPYVFNGDTITYLLADACLPTAYAFPNLLAYTTERGATGIDEAAEVRRILAGDPPVIVTTDRRLAIWNPASLAALRSALTRRYRLSLSVPRSDWHTLVYIRRRAATERRSR
ncbi:hypothetical protein GCM10011380_03420 [Sphingomonas metalli]|uniref:Glycosyltransferase RgtA/B/C/D-like domain-containing protein n=1 Tax=Sphingomonas metalli TaxID=1779358 RepID=A0A916SUZ8_9SPHN|nr:hypothetical protein GCM10011380_03420 [Sphingomonas metalli]